MAKSYIKAIDNNSNETLELINEQTLNGVYLT